MPRTVRNPKYGYTQSVYTIDDLIANLESLRAKHGGDVGVACMKDSSDSVHLLDGLFGFMPAENAWNDEDRYLGDMVVTGIND